MFKDLIDGSPVILLRASQTAAVVRAVRVRKTAEAGQAHKSFSHVKEACVQNGNLLKWFEPGI